MTRLSEPTKSTRQWLAKHSAIVSDFKRIARKNGVRVRRHSPAYELGATLVFPKTVTGGK